MLLLLFGNIYLNKKICRYLYIKIKIFEYENKWLTYHITHYIIIL